MYGRIMSHHKAPHLYNAGMEHIGFPSTRQILLASSAKRTRGRGGGTHFVACFGRLNIDLASISRRSTVPTPTRGNGGGVAGACTWKV